MHAVVWEVPAAERHTSVLHASRTLLWRHLGVARSHVHATIGGCDELLAGDAGMGLSHTSSPALCRAFEKLSSSIRNLVSPS